MTSNDIKQHIIKRELLCILDDNIKCYIANCKIYGSLLLWESYCCM